MNDTTKEQIKSILNSEGWIEVEAMLREPLEDYVEGRYEDIAIHILAKKKAEAHINFVINKLKSLYVAEQLAKTSFK